MRQTPPREQESKPPELAFGGHARADELRVRPIDQAALDASVTSLTGVGAKTAASLGRLGIASVRDLMLYRPRRYEPPAPQRTLAELFAGEEASVDVEVVNVSVRRTRRRSLTILEALVRDETGSMVATWFNQAWLADKLAPGVQVQLRGSLERGDFVVRAYEIGDEPLEEITPVYPASEALATKRIRDLVKLALEQVESIGDPLPALVRARQRLPGKVDALRVLHAPRLSGEEETARRRLAFEELLVLQLGLAARPGQEVRAAQPFAEPGETIVRYRESLPFSLTPSQETVIGEIDGDLARNEPMQRLLQGDVGSGKTVVALYTLLRAAEAGQQGALMAPTETLAEQHFLTIEGICAELGVGCVLLTSSLGAAAAREARALLETGEASLAVGTHALIQEQVAFRALGAAVVDEQHRFGVEQRHALASHQSLDDPERVPHRLYMTATPIPRTLAFTVWGDLRVSEISELPAGRKPIVTSWISHDRSSEAYRRLRAHLEDGRQAYVVCPLVAASEDSEARAAEDEAERLGHEELADHEVACIHGQLPTRRRREIMQAFAAGDVDVLVATTVIEVGVDVPNASIMIIQEADRFGLAQLHQLRGRVGRGEHQSYCLLVSRAKEELTEIATERLQAMVATTDGFELAEVDLELRGQGQLLGTRQTGLSDLRFTRLRSDQKLLERAREASRELGTPDELLAVEIARMFGDEDHRGRA